MRRERLLAVIASIAFVLLPSAALAWGSFAAALASVSCGTAYNAVLPVEPSTSSALCALGTPSVLTGAGIGPWSWSCAWLAGTANCSATASAATTTYYVATAAGGGSDSNPGTIGSPWLTLQHAVLSAGPGVDIIVRAGTYTVASNIAVTASGTASAYIRIYPYSGETVTLVGPGSNASPNMLFYASGNYVEISGFIIQNGNIDLGTYCGSYDYFVGNTLSGATYQGLLLGGCTAIGQGGYNVARNNTVHNNANSNNPPVQSSWAQGITSHLDSFDLIEGNTSYNNYGEGIGSYQAFGTVFEFNTSYDNFSVQLYVDGVTGAVVNSNLVYNTGNTTFYRFGYPAEGISFAIEKYSNGIELPLYGLTIINNVVVGGRYAVIYGDYGQGGGMKNCLFANNTIYNGNLADFYVQTDANSGNVFENTIMYTNNSQPVVGGSHTGFTFDYNNWFGATVTGWTGPHDVVADPLFVAGGGTTGASYQLSTGSPAIGAGTTIAAVVANFGAVGRVAPFNIGAW